MKFLLASFLILLTNFSFAIVDGHIIEDKSFRQSVALAFKSDPFDHRAEIYCSATLVGPRVVATAAHCFRSGANAFKVSLQDFMKETWIFFGETHSERDLPMITPQFKAVRVELHPLTGAISSDVALIELSGDIDLVKWGISPAPLMIPTHEQKGLELFHVGYGQIVNGGVKGTKAFMNLPFRELNGYNGLGVGQPRTAGPSACHGDSGGSAYLRDRDGQMKFVGIEYSISNHPCGMSATYFVPITAKIIEWMKTFNRPLFL